MNSTTRNETLPGHETIDFASNICQCIILVATVAGNLMLILSLKIRQSGGLKLIDKLMLNTVVCNVLIVIISIPIELSVQHFYHYPFTNFACKLIDPMSTYFFNCCVFTYVAIAFERWIMVSSISYSPPSKVQTLLVFLAIHVCALFSVCPYMPVLKVKNEEGRIVCGETWEISSRKSYTLSLFLLQYGVPVPLLVVFYMKTWFIVYLSNKNLFQSMLQSSIKTMITATSLSVMENGRDSLFTTSTTKLGSSELCDADDEVRTKQTKAENLPDCSKYTSASQALLSPRYLSRPRTRSRRAINASSLSLSFSNLSPLPSLSTSPIESPSTSPLASAEDIRDRRRTRKQKRHPERNPSSIVSSRIARSKQRSGSKALSRRISRYFSITGGIPLKECHQVTALKRREKQTRRLLIRFTIITSVFIVCVLPNQVHWLIIDFIEKGNEYFSELTRLLIHLITYANCVINPLLYGHYDRKFRTDVCMLIRGMKEKLLG